MNEQIDLEDLDLDIKQRIEEAISQSQEDSSNGYKLCSQELLDYSLRGVSTLHV